MGSNLPVGAVVPKRIDETCMSGKHQWPLEPEACINFRYYVFEDERPRFDMMRYRMISENEMDNAKKCFALLGNTKSQVKIPLTIKCDRTLARDLEEAYYVDAIDAYLSEPSTIELKDLPILKRPLDNRLHCAFNRRPGYFAELMERTRLGLWLPFDAHENAYFSDSELTNTYPKVGPWYFKVAQPTALPIPVPFVVYYFHRKLREAQIAKDRGMRGISSGECLSERAKRLLHCLELEFYILFAAVWMTEACYGQRQFVLDAATVDVLEENIGRIESIAGHPVPVILAYMRSASKRPEILHNWLFFKDYSMQESTFVWAKKDSGEFDETQIPRQSLWLCRVKGKITLHQHGSALFTRSTTLSKTVSGPDYDKIDGLRVLAREQRWERYGSITFGNLIDNLVKLVRHYQRLQHPSEQPRSLREPPPPMVDARMRMGYTEEYTGVPANRHAHNYDQNLDRENRRDSYSMVTNEEEGYERGSSQYDRKRWIQTPQSWNADQYNNLHYNNRGRSPKRDNGRTSDGQYETRNPYDNRSPMRDNGRTSDGQYGTRNPYENRSPMRDNGRNFNEQHDNRNPYDNYRSNSHEGNRANSTQYQRCVFRSPNQFVHRSNLVGTQQNPLPRTRNCPAPDSPTYEVPSTEFRENAHSTDFPSSKEVQAPYNSSSTDRTSGKRRSPENDDWHIMTRAQKTRRGL